MTNNTLKGNADRQPTVLVPKCVPLTYRASIALDNDGDDDGRDDDDGANHDSANHFFGTACLSIMRLTSLGPT